jgi:hypothetical protein
LCEGEAEYAKEQEKSRRKGLGKAAFYFSELIAIGNRELRFINA